ncbi:collagen alpha-2(I) chain-like [Lutra lutra]|uniref:collagen alpha-2(I) chain-like n=1 Tax=Lutra lutra TaxID=9657 RepID=UPI001FD14EF9|nr:collagen alpha-2(I) chain-like [Lutra lutra]
MAPRARALTSSEGEQPAEKSRRRKAPRDGAGLSQSEAPRRPGQSEPGIAEVTGASGAECGEEGAHVTGLGPRPSPSGAAPASRPRGSPPRPDSRGERAGRAERGARPPPSGGRRGASRGRGPGGRRPRSHPGAPPGPRRRACPRDYRPPEIPERSAAGAGLRAAETRSGVGEIGLRGTAGPQGWAGTRPVSCAGPCGQFGAPGLRGPGRGGPASGGRARGGDGDELSSALAQVQANAGPGGAARCGWEVAAARGAQVRSEVCGRLGLGCANGRPVTSQEEVTSQGTWLWRWRGFEVCATLRGVGHLIGTFLLCEVGGLMGPRTGSTSVGGGRNPAGEEGTERVVPHKTLRGVLRGLPSLSSCGPGAWTRTL